MMDAGSIWIKLGLDGSGLKQGLNEAKSDISQWKSATDQSALSMQTWGSTITAVGTGAIAEFTAVGAAIYAVTNQAANFGNTIIDSAYTIGVSVDQMQRLKAAGVSVGIPLDSISFSARMLAQRLGDTGTAGDSLRARLEELGVETKDSNGNLRDQVDIYWDVITAIGSTEDPMARANLGVDLLGRNWAAVSPLIHDAEKAKKAYADADPFSDAETERMHEYSLKMDAVGEKWDHMVTTIGSRLIPVADAGASAIGNFLDIEDRGINNIHDSLANLYAFAADPTAKMMGTPGWDTQYTDMMDTIARNKIVADNNARGMTPAAVGPKTTLEDPFKGLTAKQAEIKLMSDVTIPALEKALLAAETNGDIAAAQKASLELLQAREKLTTDLTDSTQESTGKIVELVKSQIISIDELTNAYNLGNISAQEYADILNGLENSKINDQLVTEKKLIQDVAQERKALLDLEKNYARDLQTLDPRDIRGFINLNVQHKYAVEDQKEKISTSEAGINAIRSGTPSGQTEIKTSPVLPVPIAAPPAPALATLASKPSQEPIRDTLRSVERPESMPVPLPVTLAPEPKTANISPVSFNRTQEDIDRFMISLPSPFLSQQNPEKSIEPITGASHYDKTQAKTPFPFTIHITGPITVNGDKSFEKMLQDQRIAAGVRLK